ncbi:TetR-like C-terminal domain-containing protein [Clostridium sp. C8-1-8]|uniref:TetR-like C-terminal domain-containing protein n=1 Tax=Clostridium sp. C8-1-8 TaxID=2698831 RepID=UPI00136BD7B9|nr:TetR-like C-terminal domain-containing protein [Clostridium sp. C8-1-8]
MSRITIEESNSTKCKIRNAFIEIYKVKSLDLISVKEITSWANLNRGTFYIYYENIYAMLDEIEYEIISDLTRMTNNLPEKTLTTNPEELVILIRPIFEYIEKNYDYFLALLGESSRPTFKNQLTNLMKDNLTRRFILRNSNLGDLQKYVIEYFIGGQVGIILYWIKSGIKISSDEIINLITKLICFGIVDI